MRSGATRSCVDSAAAVGEKQAAAEVDLGIERIFTYAAWADKFDGAVHNPPFRNIAIAMNEADRDGRRDLSRGSAAAWLFVARDAAARRGQHRDRGSFRNNIRSLPAIFYQLFDTSDLPGGAVNIVTGYVSQLLKTLAEHDDIDAIWCYRDEATVAAAKAMSIGNLKQVWTNEGRAIDWFDPKVAEGRWFLEHATQVKNIWVPYGE